MKHRTIGRTTASLLAASGSLLLLASLSGCESTPETAEAPVVDTSGPPPEGFASWEDYWKAKDRDYRDFEHDVRMLEMTRQRTPGAPQ